MIHLIKNADGYNDPTVDKAFSNVLKRPVSEQEIKALARLKNSCDSSVLLPVNSALRLKSV